ncbi:MAG: DUF4270 domain-containing protein [Bacteroidales bacterium]|nr:DUF4270 domain-containing protein [Bacteroidales bacterium]
MKNKIYIALISISMLIFSCQRDTDLGYNILPAGDLINHNITDTVSIEVHTLTTDSVITSGVNELMLGEYKDPIFGYSKASFVLQFFNPQFINFKDTDIVDSVILTLSYNQNDNNTYGDLSKDQTIEVYKIGLDLDNSINYYGNDDPNKYMGELIGDTVGFRPSPEDTTLHIKLNNSFGDFFLDADESNYTSGQAFKNFFKGLYIKSESPDDDGAVIKYDINESLLVSIYFHKTGDTAQYTYQISANNISNVRFNLFEHDYTSANFTGTFDDESLPQDSLAYIQSGGGLYTRIKFPYLENLGNSEKIVINRAELIINSAPTNISCENDFPAINKTLITGHNSDNSSTLIPDYISPSGYATEKYTDGTYRYDIAAYIQNIFDGTTENNGINLYPASDGSNFSRTVITTGNNSNPMKLVITYTKILN